MKTKLPVKRYECDDLTVEAQGESYTPHVGEWVEMRGGLSWDFRRMTAELFSVQSGDTGNVGETMSKTMQELTEFLASRIVRWNWTGNDGKKLPNPPDVKTVADLTEDEVMWLISTLREGKTPDVAKRAEENA